MEVLQRFSRVYLGDSIINRIEIDIAASRCSFFISGASLLKDEPSSSIFDPEQHYAPACLTFEVVRSISCPEGSFFLNSTIVDFEAKPSDGGLSAFRLVMTGGFDNETFTRSLLILARQLSLGLPPERTGG